MDYQAYLKNTGKYQEPAKEEPKAENKQIDWEQRRYEIAREVFCIQEAQYLDDNQKMAEIAVLAADALIKELKKKGEQE